MEFKGIGRLVTILILVPSTTEAVIAALCSKWMLSLPWLLSFANGFCLAAVSPCLLIPTAVELIHHKRGIKKGIPSIMFAASTLEDIFVINVFSVFVSVYFS